MHVADPSSLWSWGTYGMSFTSVRDIPASVVSRPYLSDWVQHAFLVWGVHEEQLRVFFLLLLQVSFKSQFLLLLLFLKDRGQLTCTCTQSGRAEAERGTPQVALSWMKLIDMWKWQHEGEATKVEQTVSLGLTFLFSYSLNLFCHIKRAGNGTYRMLPDLSDYTNNVWFLSANNELHLPGLLKAVQTISLLFATVVLQHWQQILGWRAVLNPNHWKEERATLTSKTHNPASMFIPSYLQLWGHIKHFAVFHMNLWPPLTTN